MHGWKLDVEKEIPYFALEVRGARNVMNIPCTPLRVSKRGANSLLWTIFTAFQSSPTWITQRVGGWKKNRNYREAETLARILDLLITEFGTRTVERSAACEVLLRRLNALVIADGQGHWEMACLLEEVPSAKTLQVHEVVVKDLTNMAGLITKAHDTGKDKTPGLEEE